MKKTKIILAIVAIVCIASAFAGCGTVSFKKAYTGKYEAEETKIVDIAEDLDNFTKSGKLFIGKKVKDEKTTQYIYNEKAELKLTLPNGDKTIYNLNRYDNYLRVKKTDNTGSEPKVTYTYYDYDFNVLVAESEQASEIDQIGSFLFVNNDFYQLDKEGKTLIDTKKTASVNIDIKASIASEVVPFNGLFYIIESGEVMIFNDNLELVAQYKIPEYAADYPMSINLLPNGNIIGQYAVRVPDDAKKFDLLQGAEKYDLVTEILDVKKNKIKSINTDYIYEIGFVDGFDSEIGFLDFEKMGYNPDLKAVYMAFKIVDKRINLSEYDIEFVTLKNNGKVNKVLEKQVIGQSSPLLAITENRYVAISSTMSAYLFNEEGENLGQVPPYSFIPFISGTPFKGGVYSAIVNGKLTLYNTSLEVVKAYDADSDASFVEGNELCGFIEYWAKDSNGEYKEYVDVYMNGEKVRTEDSDMFYSYAFGFAIKSVVDDKVTLKYYDFNNTLICESNENVDVDYGNCVITIETTTGETVKTTYKAVINPLYIN